LCNQAGVDMVLFHFKLQAFFTIRIVDHKHY
jgi:hypothetical protein